MEIYTFDKWTEKDIPNFTPNEIVTPKLSLQAGKTTAPSLLTEADLITVMDQNGIGTDATIHEHIKKVQDRGYCKKSGIYIMPLQLGFALVKTYQAV